MSTRFRSDQYTRAGKRNTRVQRFSSCATLGLVAISLLLLLTPVFAAGGEPEASKDACATQSGALTRFHGTKPVSDPANGAWSFAQAEFLMAKIGADGLARAARCEALARFHRSKPVDDPANGAWCLAEAEFYVARYGTDKAACFSWPEALARFQQAKPVGDPANGAWSQAQAEFFVAKYGGDGAVIVTLKDDARAFSCDSEPVAVGPES